MTDRLTNAGINSILKTAAQQGKLQFRVSSQSFTLDGQSMAASSIASIFASRLDVCRTRVSDALTAFRHEATVGQKKEAEQWVVRNDKLPQTDKYLRVWLKLMTRQTVSNDMHEANVLVMTQWLWQVKRAMSGLSFSYPVLPIFWSREQGTGKSFNTLRLVQHLKPFTRYLNVDELGEKFDGEMSVNTFIVFLDEFAGARKMDISKLKAIISGKPIEQRGMFSSGGIAGPNLMSVIATSNENPPHGFEDETGARRLWSLHCSGDSMQRDPIRRRALDDLDYELIWTAARCQDPSPYGNAPERMVSYIEKVRDKQLRTRSVEEAFVDEMCERCTLDLKWSLVDLCKSLREYAFDTKQKLEKGSYKKRAEALKNVGLEVVNCKNTYYVKGLRLKDVDAAA